MRTQYIRGSLFERIVAKVDFTGNCWIWTGSTTTYGYASVGNPGGTKRAHRLLYEICVGPIPDGLVLDHLCRIRHCVNPDHLEPVTLRQNTLRGTSLSAANAAKTQCRNGHPFSTANTAAVAKGRRCRTCHRESERQRYASKKR